MQAAQAVEEEALHIVQVQPLGQRLQLLRLQIWQAVHQGEVSQGQEGLTQGLEKGGAGHLPQCGALIHVI